MTDERDEREGGERRSPLDVGDTDALLEELRRRAAEESIQAAHETTHASVADEARVTRNPAPPAADFPTDSAAPGDDLVAAIDELGPDTLSGTDTPTAETDSGETARSAEAEASAREPAAETADDSHAAAALEGPNLEQLMAAIDRDLADETSPNESHAPAQAPEAGNATRHIVFSLADTHYAVRLDSVVEVGVPSQLTIVPNVPAWVLGVTNLRGDVLAVLDLRLLLELGTGDEKRSERMLIVRAGEDEMSAGLIVDGIHGVASVDTERLSAPTAPIATRVAPFLVGVQERDDRLLAVIDVERLMLSPDVRQFEAQ